jgi:hypothetical protein
VISLVIALNCFSGDCSVYVDFVVAVDTPPDEAHLGTVYVHALPMQARHHYSHMGRAVYALPNLAEDLFLLQLYYS